MFFFHVSLITNTNNVARKQQIAKENRITIVALAKEGYSYRKIAEKPKISKLGVTSTLSRYRDKNDNMQRIKNRRHVFVEGYVFSNGQKFQRKLLKRGEVLPEEKCKLW